MNDRRNTRLRPSTSILLALNIPAMMADPVMLPKYRLVEYSPAAEPAWWWLHMNAAGMNVKIEDESQDVAAAALQGPTSRAILKQVCDADLDSLKYFCVTRAAVDGINVEISRTGYTGDLGYEIWVPAKDAERLWDVLMAVGKPYGIIPSGMEAMLTARAVASR